MAIEIEAKIRLDDPAALRGALAALGAAYGGERALRDHYFDTHDERLYRDGCSLRLRQFGRNVLTYKGPMLDGRFKRREELQVPVEEPERLMELLGRLGFRRVFSYEKRREYWELASCRVCLDKLPALGWFVEIEGPDAAAITGVLGSLGLADRPVIRESYLHLVLEHARRSQPQNNCLYFDQATAGP